MIPWKNYSNMTRQAISADIEARITKNTYEDGEWTLTEIVRQKTIGAKLALLKIGNRNLDATRAIGYPMQFDVKLKVLSRHACRFDKDGNYINTFDRYKLPSDKTETFVMGNGETKKFIYPDMKDPPKAGDKVYVKLDINNKSDDKKWRELAELKFEEMSGREVKQAEWLYTHEIYTVDKNGCITVNIPEIAIQMLKTKGERIAKPRHSKATIVQPGEKKIPERLVSNWHFKEMSPQKLVSSEKSAPPVEPVAEAG